MSNLLQVKVTSRTSSEDGQEFWEGTVSLDGVKPTKLARKSDGNTRFTTRSSVVGAARRFAERYGYSDVDLGESKSVTTTKKAAKKSVSSTSSSTSP